MFGPKIPRRDLWPERAWRAFRPNDWRALRIRSARVYTVNLPERDQPSVWAPTSHDMRVLRQIDVSGTYQE